jgi:hypothetical protein
MARCAGSEPIALSACAIGLHFCTAEDIAIRRHDDAFSAATHSANSRGWYQGLLYRLLFVTDAADFNVTTRCNDIGGIR